MLSDYLTICKPRVVLLMLVTAWVGMYLASVNNPSNWITIIAATIGITCAACAAAIINHLLDRHIDQKMSRTSNRPIACNRIKPQKAILLAALLTLLACLILSFKVNLLTTVLSFATLIGYAFLYTLYLKHATPQNIVIGGLSGAMPPLLGWTAITGSINAYPLLLVLIIFTWTPPHFWALAIYRHNDYQSADIPMLPVTHGIKFTKLYLLLYTLLLSAVTCLPFVIGMAGLRYLCISCALNFVFMYLAIKLYISMDKQEHKLAIYTFNYSILYLFLLFIGLVV